MILQSEMFTENLTLINDNSEAIGLLIYEGGNLVGCKRNYDKKHLETSDKTKCINFLTFNNSNQTNQLNLI